MGHYCRICGRTLANEKFTGKGHKNHICKNCSKKCNRKENKNKSNKNDLVLDIGMISEDKANQMRILYNEDICFAEICQEESNMDIDDEEEILF